MKLTCVLLSLAMAASAMAGFKIPSGVFNHNEMDKAISKAQEEELPLVFLYTDKGTT